MNLPRRRLLQAAATVLSLGAAQMARGASILAVRVWPAAEYTRVTIESDSALQTQTQFVANPRRVRGYKWKVQVQFGRNSPAPKKAPSRVFLPKNVKIAENIGNAQEHKVIKLPNNGYGQTGQNSLKCFQLKEKKSNHTNRKPPKIGDEWVFSWADRDYFYHSMVFGCQKIGGFFGGPTFE